MLELGSSLEKFNLLNTVSGNDFSSSELDEAKPSLIMFICNHCPYVIHYHDEIKRLAGDYTEILNMVAISSNDIENYPQDGPDKMSELWKDLGLSFPYLFDSTQEIAKKYKVDRFRFDFLRPIKQPSKTSSCNIQVVLYSSWFYLLI